jgi:membrane associated rhomboid family serine protease
MEQEPTSPIQTLAEEKNRFLNRLLFTLAMVALIWTVHLAQVVLHLDWGQAGVIPRTLKGAGGIALMPFLHRDFGHLIANTVPLAVLILGTLQFFPSVGTRVLLGVHLMSGSLVWLLARPAIHIGASGMIYGLGGFLFFSGVFRRDVKSLAVACLVAFLYGGMVWGVLPMDPQISWEGHLFGAAAGTACAWLARKSDRPKGYSWEEEEEADLLPWERKHHEPSD